jgi:hypothetical protein
MVTAAVALTAALAELAESGVGWPCVVDPDAWFEGGPRKLAERAVQCRACPVVRLCGAVADEAEERFGVWGGVDRTDHQQLRRAAAS